MCDVISSAYVSMNEVAWLPTRVRGTPSGSSSELNAGVCVLVFYWPESCMLSNCTILSLYNCTILYDVIVVYWPLQTSTIRFQPMECGCKTINNIAFAHTVVSISKQRH